MMTLADIARQAQRVVDAHERCDITARPHRLIVEIKKLKEGLSMYKEALANNQMPRTIEKRVYCPIEREWR